MDRWIFSPKIDKAAKVLFEASNCTLYDGEVKTSYKHGEILLTETHLYWCDVDWKECANPIALYSTLVVLTEEHSESSFFSSKHFVTLHLMQSPPDKATGPVSYSPAHSVRISLPSDNHRQRFKQAVDYLVENRSIIKQASSSGVSRQTTQQPVSVRPYRPTKAGIGSIEQSLNAKSKQMGSHISLAFEDMSQLMVKAKEMVQLSRQIAEKMRSAQAGEMSEDETAKFKSYMMSLGIPNPVTKDQHSSVDQYYASLANEISNTLLPIVRERSGVMTLPDAFCYINRARGFELISPDDFGKACKVLSKTPNAKLTMHKYANGVAVLKLSDFNDTKVAQETADKVSEHGCLSVEHLSRLIGISVILAKERLLAAEKLSLLCRDESMEGLKFFPNLFMSS